MGLGQAQLPGQAGVVDGRAGRRAGAAVVAGDQDDLRAGLGHATGDGAYAGLRHQLDRDARGAVGVLEVVDQLGQILDGVDVVVRRRRDQRHAGGGVAGPGDPRIDLFAGQMTALAGLCALRHLDLDLLGAEQVFAGHAEAAGGHLLDGGAALGVQALGALAALAGVGAPADGVHGQRQTFVGLLRDGAVGHRAGLEAVDDGFDALDLVDGNRRALVKGEFQRAAQRVGLGGVVHHGGIFLEALVISVSGGLLQRDDGLGVVHVILAGFAGAQAMDAGGIQRLVHGQVQRVEGAAVAVLHVLGDFLQADAAHAADGVGEVLADDLLADADGFEDLGALVGLDGGDAHLGRDLDDAVEHGFVVVAHGGVIVLFHQALVDQLADHLMGQIGVDRPRAEAQQRGEVVNVAGLAALQNDGNGGALLGAHQMLLQRRHRQQRRDGHMVFIHAAVGQDQDVGAVAVGAVAADEQPVQRTVQRRGLVIQQRDGLHREAGALHVLDLHQIGVAEDRAFQLQHGAVFRLFHQQVAVGADIYRGVGDDLFADGVDGRIGDLREELLEVVEQRLMLFGQHRQRDVDTHGGDGFAGVERHGDHTGLQLLVGIAEGAVQRVAALLVVGFDGLIGQRQVAELHQMLVQPFAIGLAGGVVALELVVVDDAAGAGVHQQHPARRQAGLYGDLLRRDVQHTHLGGQDQIIVVGDIVAGRAQAVAVERGAHHIAVGEQDGRRAVPRLHHGGVIVVEVALFAGDVALMLPRLGNGDHHGLGQIHAVHHQEFQRVVQHGGVGALGADGGQDLVDLVAQQLGGHTLVAAVHAVDVAADGVDLTVVQDQAVRMGALPAGGGVGGEAGVNHGDGRGIALVLQVRIEFAKLIHQEHALVDDGAAGEGADVGVVVALLKHAAGDVEPAVEVDAAGDRLRARQEALADVGHAVAGALAEDFRVRGHVAPAEEVQPFLFGDDLERLFGAADQQRVLRKEEHAHAVIPRIQTLNAGNDLAEQLVGDLGEDAHAVAGIARGVLACAVSQPLDDLQRVVHRHVRADALYADDRADAACIVLKTGIVESHLVCFHGSNVLSRAAGTDSIRRDENKKEQRSSIKMKAPLLAMEVLYRVIMGKSISKMGK